MLALQEGESWVEITYLGILGVRSLSGMRWTRCGEVSLARPWFLVDGSLDPLCKHLYLGTPQDFAQLCTLHDVIVATSSGRNIGLSPEFTNWYIHIALMLT